MRKNYCQACSFAKFGVKTRIYIEHTCGLDDEPVSKPKKKAVVLKAAKKLKSDRLMFSPCVLYGGVSFVGLGLKAGTG